MEGNYMQDELKNSLKAMTKQAEIMRALEEMVRG